MIEFKNISKFYSVGLFGKKHFVALDDVSVKIKKGEIISLIGESGSGKTTIGKVILKLIRPTHGEILLDGENVTHLKKGKMKNYYSKVQGVFQDPFSTFNPIFKADRIFRIVHKQFFPEVSKEEWEKRVIDSLKSVGLNPEEVLRKYTHQLSGGQLQRFLIARALLLDVQFLVADEIISMLDASTRIDVLNLLAELKTKGLSILFITHDLNLGYYISDTVMILYQGSVVESGATEEVFNNPQHPYTKMLLDSVPRLDRKWDANEKSTFTAKKGESDIVNECHFHDRCAQKDKNCNKTPLTEFAKDHWVACSQVKKIS